MRVPLGCCACLDRHMGGSEEYQATAERMRRDARNAYSFGRRIRLAILAEQFEEAARYFEREQAERVRLSHVNENRV